MDWIKLVKQSAQELLNSENWQDPKYKWPNHSLIRILCDFETNVEKQTFHKTKWWEPATSIERANHGILKEGDVYYETDLYMSFDLPKGTSEYCRICEFNAETPKLQGIARSLHIRLINIVMKRSGKIKRELPDGKIRYTYLCKVFFRKPRAIEVEGGLVEL